MKKHLLSIIIPSLFLLSCKNQSIPDSFIGPWYLLTQMENKYVVFYPCDMSPGFLEITDKEVKVGGSHDIDVFTIQETSYNNSILTITTSPPEYLVNSPESIDFIFTLKPEGIEHKNSLYGKEGKYPSYEQPCKECWEDCD